MMFVSDTIERIDILVPNNLSDRLKMMFLSDLQREIFRDYPLPEAIFSFTTIVGQQVYDLPDDCPEDRISQVAVDGDDLDYVSVVQNENLPDAYWTIISGKLMIEPDPTSVVLVTLLYKSRPADYTVGTQTIGLSDDYYYLLVYGVAKKVALVMKNVDSLKFCDT